MFSRHVWLILAAGALGALMLAALALAGWAEARPVLWSGLILAAATGLLAAAAAASRPEPLAQSLLAEAPAERAALPYAELIDALPDPLLVIAARERDDPIGRRFVLVNAAARELLRIRRNEGLVVTVLRDPPVLAALDEALFEGRHGKASYEAAGAPPRILRVAARPLPAAADGTRRALISFHDDTQAHLIEQTRADFLANASHELRTPLASLMGFIETLRGHAKGDAAAQERFLEVMQTQAERMARLVGDLMSLSRIELSEHIAPSGEADLSAVAREVAEALAPQVKARRLQLTIAPDVAAAPLVGERDQVVQVVQNLVENAMKYSPEGGEVRIELACDLPADAAARLRDPEALRLALVTPDHREARYSAITVIDKGPGIAREHLPRLTERFYRAPGQKSGERLGTGLGLAIVKHIMSRHQGGLVVESTPERGSAFTAYFPAPATEARKAEQPQQ